MQTFRMGRIRLLPEPTWGQHPPFPRSIALRHAGAKGIVLLTCLDVSWAERDRRSAMDSCNRFLRLSTSEDSSACLALAMACWPEHRCCNWVHCFVKRSTWVTSRAFVRARDELFSANFCDCAALEAWAAPASCWSLVSWALQSHHHQTVIHPVSHVDSLN